MAKELDGHKMPTEIAKAVGMTVVFSLLAVLIFALIIKLGNLDSGVIKPVNRFIKVIGIFLGCFFSFSNTKGIVKGAIAGVVSVILTFLIFSLIGGGIEFDWTFPLELLFGALVGGICGVITVNLRKN